MLNSAIAVSDFLINYLSESGMLLFAGAGIGKQVNLPDWNQFAERIAAFAEKYEPEIAPLMRSRIHAQRYPEAFAFLDQCDNLPSADKFKALAQPFVDPEPNPDPLLPLVRLPFEAIITTNFDATLINAYAKAHGNSPPLPAANAVPNQVRPPVIIKSVPAEYTLRARAAKLNGSVIVSCRVDLEGVPQDCTVTKPLGLGLDEEALKAVRQYRFSPAVNLNTGKPVSFPITIEQKFVLY